MPQLPSLSGVVSCWRSGLAAASVLMLGACQSVPLPPLATVRQLDLQRFMGDWYVIAAIPTFLETEACNAVESYRLQPDGTVATTFTFHKGSPEGPLKRYEPVGFVKDPVSQAVWGMQFIWPFKADYRVTWINDDYTQTIISREARDYVWIMAKSAAIPDEDYQALRARVAAQGYKMEQLRKVPQVWAPGSHPPAAVGDH